MTDYAVAERLKRPPDSTRRLTAADNVSRQRGEALAERTVVGVVVDLAIRAQQHLVDDIVGAQLTGGEVAGRFQVRDLMTNELGELVTNTEVDGRVVTRRGEPDVTTPREPRRRLLVPVDGVALARVRRA